MRRRITALTLGLLLATGTSALHAQGTGTDTEETAGQPSTLTDEDTREDATRAGAIDAPVVQPTDIPLDKLDRARPNMGNPEEYNDPGRWGLLGLLGLAGLMGRRRTDRAAPMPRPDAAAR